MSREAEGYQGLSNCVELLQAAIIAYYNDKIAKPFKWTYQGKVLTA
ncbi:MAG: hypothetical protein ACFCU7_15450 [Pleurocapsa sp.]